MDEKSHPQEESERTLVETMRQWRRANPQATLTEIEEAVEAELAQLRRALVTELAQAGESSLPEAPPCARCGRAMVKNGQKNRRLRTKEGQTLELRRQQWRCLRCGTTLFPPG